MAFHVPEKYRVKDEPMGSTAADGNNGHFDIPSPLGRGVLCCIASDGMGWEHVSSKVVNGHTQKVPSWQEMCFLKDTFWDAEDWVVQYHPAAAEYVNVTPYVLHLWKPTTGELPHPPSILVGPLAKGSRN